MKILLVATLAFALTFSGCSFTMSQFETVLNEVGPAVVTILQIVALVEGHPLAGAADISSKISADVGAAEKLYTDLSAADAAAKPSIEKQITASLTALQADLTTVFSLAQVKDANTQMKIAALIGLIQSAVTIAEAAIPAAPAATASKPLALTPSQLVDSYNKILTAKTGNAAVDAFTPKHRIHMHSKAVRVLSLGIAK